MVIQKKGIAYLVEQENKKMGQSRGNLLRPRQEAIPNKGGRKNKVIIKE